MPAMLVAVVGGKQRGEGVGKEHKSPLYKRGCSKRGMRNGSIFRRWSCQLLRGQRARGGSRLGAAASQPLPHPVPQQADLGGRASPEVCVVVAVAGSIASTMPQKACRHGEMQAVSAERMDEWRSSRRQTPRQTPTSNPTTELTANPTANVNAVNIEPKAFCLRGGDLWLVFFGLRRNCRPRKTAAGLSVARLLSSGQHRVKR